MSERVKFKEEPWHKYYQAELKAKYSPLVKLLASRLQEGTKKRNPNVTRRFVWWDIENHSIAVAEAAHIMANGHNLNPDASVEEITAGALLHDITKPQDIIFDDYKSQADTQRIMIQNLIAGGHASQKDLERFDNDTEQGLSIYEAGIQDWEAARLLRKHRNLLSQFGEPRKILELSDSSGLPVLDLPKDKEGHHLISPSARIIFVADQLVQGTKIVSLKERHQGARNRYNTKLIDKLYEYAYRCADEIAQGLGLSSYEELPSFVQTQIEAVSDL